MEEKGKPSSLRIPGPGRGTAFGFEVRSDLPFQHLRNGEGEPLDVVAVDIDERPGAGDRLLVEWKPPLDNFTGRLYDDGKRYLLWVAGTGWFRIDTAAREIIVPVFKGVSKVEDKIWGIPAMLCFTARGDHALNATAVEVNGAAVLIAGPREGGRLSLAAAFAAKGHRVLSQDHACMRLGSTTGLVPGPSQLLIPKNEMPQLDTNTGNGTWRDEKNHYSLDATRRGTCKTIPVRCVVLLRNGDENRGIEPIAPAQAISDLWSLSFRLPTEDDRGRCFEGVADLATNVPVFEMNYAGTNNLLTLTDRIAASALEYA